MKKIFLFAITAIIGMAYTACNNKWKDELYIQMVSFKALQGSNSMYNMYIGYKADGAGQYKLPVIASGSAPNASGIDVKIDVDNDALNIPSEACFAVGRNDLWFKQSLERFYSFPFPTCHTPSGKVIANYIIDFSLSGPDLNEQWVLPLIIEPSSSYAQGICKGQYKAPLNINLFDDYSGRYSVTNMSIYTDGATDGPAAEDNCLARVIDDHSVFFYAGAAWEEDVDRYKYKVIATLGEGTSNAEGSITGPVAITAGDPADEVAIDQSGNCTYSYRVSKHPTRPYLERRAMTLYLDYKYSDIASDPNNPIRLHCKESMIMGRQYNILIPDEEQAIPW